MVETPEICSILEWDSDFFGFKIARVNGNRLEVNTTARILDWCRENGVRCLYFLADGDHPETTRLAEKNGFHLTDIRVTFECSLAGLGSGNPLGEVTRPALPQDIPALRRIAASSYHDSRFYFDDRFSRAACDHLYETWIENSMAGYAQAVLVAGLPGRPEGFITCHTKPEQHKGQIGLVGVDEAARGHGTGRTLVLESLHWFAGQGLESVQVVTQGRNIAAQRLYEKCGFLTVEIKNWYHRWFGEE